MKRLTRNHSIFAMDKQNHPVLYVDSGERFVVETEDCFSHQIVESDDVLNDNFDYSRVNPATGPIFVNGCQQGNTCLLYTSPSPRDGLLSRMPSSA